MILKMMVFTCLSFRKRQSSRDLHMNMPLSKSLSTKICQTQLWLITLLNRQCFRYISILTNQTWKPHLNRHQLIVLRNHLKVHGINHILFLLTVLLLEKNCTCEMESGVVLGSSTSIVGQESTLPPVFQWSYWQTCLTVKFFCRPNVGTSYVKEEFRSFSDFNLPLRLLNDVETRYGSTLSIFKPYLHIETVMQSAHDAIIPDKARSNAARSWETLNSTERVGFENVVSIPQDIEDTAALLGRNSKPVAQSFQW